MDVGSLAETLAEGYESCLGYGLNLNKKGLKTYVAEVVAELLLGPAA